LIAPVIFDHYYEFHLTVVAAPLVFLLAVWHDRRSYTRRIAFDLTLGVALGLIIFIAAGLLREIQVDRKSASVTQRNFYGALTVFDYYKDEPNHHYRVLQHGTITHGLQFVEPLAAKWATSYYSDRSGIGLAITHFPREQNRRIGLVGLGTGSLSIYGRPGDYLRIYEINPIVVHFATNYFTYLKDSEYKIDIALGDARLTMEKELERGEDQKFDIIALDAFSSDAIPAHLLTVQAFEIYRKHLKPDGVIVVHVSNRYLDLRPVVLKLAENINWQTVTIDDDPDDSEDRSDKWWFYASTWILVSQNQELLGKDAIRGNAYEYSEEAELKKKQSRLWTDDYSALFEVLY
ncbi:MAG: integral rane protein-like protein, partial [Verrucomicrobia bacterium]|nr:integral rane protein-like protein [Verrucomicrobiota bacterium]